jgi:hypothetical protein
VSRRFSWSYDLVVPAGETAAIVHFAIQDSDWEHASAAASALSRLEGRALDGIPPETLERILNFPLAPEGTPFLRGDVNADEVLNIADAIALLSYLFLDGSYDVPCEKSADADDTGSLELTDAVYVLNFLFLGGPEPARPFPGCGSDPTEDPLSCASFEACP